ncbi:MAG: nicotinate-nucleotide adenylyltransferase [Hyphomicrobiaceae bacterium]
MARPGFRKSAPVSFGSIAARPPLCAPGQRIGLLGGSFNPPHAAHVMISETALKRLGLDTVWWIVTPGNPLKDHDDLEQQEARIAASVAIVGRRPIRITGFESALPSAYTAATLDFLRRRYPRVRFVWLMGADNLRNFHRWQDWRGIAQSVPIAIIDRPTHRFRALASPAAGALRAHFVPERTARALAVQTPPAWTFLTGRLSPLSSTMIRKAERRGGRADAARNSSHDDNN